MAATDAGTISAEIRIEIEALRKDLNTAISLFRKTATDIDDSSKKASGSTNRLKSSIKDLAAPFIAVKMAADMVIGAVKSFFSFMNANVQAYTAHQTELAKLETLLRTTGGAAWTTAGQLEDMADRLSRITRFAQNDIMKAQSVLLGFRSLTGETYERTLRLMMDSVTVMGGDLVSAANTFGKALEDPVQGMTALNRQGYNFRAEDKIMIQQMIESEGIFAARSWLIQQLEKDYGGTAEAANAATEAMSAHQRSLKASESLARETGRQTGGFYAATVNFWALIKESYSEFFKHTEDLRSVPAELEQMRNAYSRAIAPVKELSNEIIQLELQVVDMRDAFADANRGVYETSEAFERAFLAATPAARALNEQIKELEERRAGPEIRTAQLHVELLQKELALMEAQYYNLVQQGKHNTAIGKELRTQMGYHQYLVAQAEHRRNELQNTQAMLVSHREDQERMNKVAEDELEKINDIERDRARIVAETTELYRRGAVTIDEYYSRIAAAYQAEAAKINQIYVGANNLLTTTEGRLRVQNRANAALEEAIRLQLAWNQAAANRTMTEREFIQERDEILARYTRAVAHLDKMREARQISEEEYEKRILDLQQRRINGLDELIERSGFQAPVTMAMVEGFQELLNIQERTVAMYGLETDLLEEAKELTDQRRRIGKHELEINAMNLAAERARLAEMVRRGQIQQWVMDMYIDSLEALHTATARQDVNLLLEDYNKRLARLSMTTKQALEAERQEALRNIEVYRNTEGYDALVAGINRYYDALKRTDSWQSFAKNFTMYFGEAMKIAQTLSDMIITLSRRENDQQIKNLEERIAASKKLLDEELQHRLYLLGLAEAKTEEQFERNLQLAIESGDSREYLKPIKHTKSLCWNKSMRKNKKNLNKNWQMKKQN